MTTSHRDSGVWRLVREGPGVAAAATVIVGVLTLSIIGLVALIDRSDDWLAKAAAVGTVAAALGAAWAAIVSSIASRAAMRSADATAAMLEVERLRDAERATAERSRQALLTFLEIDSRIKSIRPLSLMLEFRCTNLSDAPVMKAMLKAGAGDQVWGPSSIASVGAGRTRSMLVDEEFFGTRAVAAELLFLDASGQWWLRRAGREPRSASPDEVAQWRRDRETWLRSRESLPLLHVGFPGGGAADVYKDLALALWRWPLKWNVTRTLVALLGSSPRRLSPRPGRIRGETEHNPTTSDSPGAS